MCDRDRLVADGQSFVAGQKCVHPFGVTLPPAMDCCEELFESDAKIKKPDNSPA
jgi:hypothetical protein